MPLWRRNRKADAVAPTGSGEHFDDRRPSEHPLPGGRAGDGGGGGGSDNVGIIVSDRKPRFATSTMRDVLVLLNMVEDNDMTTLEGKSILPIPHEIPSYDPAAGTLLSSDAERVLDSLAKGLFLTVSVFVLVCMTMALVLKLLETPLTAQLQYLGDWTEEGFLENVVYTGLTGALYTIRLPLTLNIFNPNVYGSTLRSVELGYTLIKNASCALESMNSLNPPLPRSAQCLMCDARTLFTTPPYRWISRPYPHEGTETICEMDDTIFRTVNVYVGCPMCGDPGLLTQVNFTMTSYACLAYFETKSLLENCAENEGRVFLNITLIKTERFKWFFSDYQRQSSWVVSWVPCYDQPVEEYIQCDRFLGPEE